MSDDLPGVEIHEIGTGKITWHTVTSITNNDLMTNKILYVTYNSYRYLRIINQWIYYICLSINSEL